MEIIGQGGYYNEHRIWVPIRDPRALAHSVYYDEFFDFDGRPTSMKEEEHERRSSHPHPPIPRSTIGQTVTQETSNQAAERLVSAMNAASSSIHGPQKTTPTYDAQCAEQEAASSPTPRSAGPCRWRVLSASSSQVLSASNESPAPAPAPPSASSADAKSLASASLHDAAPPTRASSYKASSTTRASASAPKKKVAILNYASAKNPGGGFLNGAVAQEECLARSSTLYPALLTCKQFYENWKHSTTHTSSTSSLEDSGSANVYTDRIIYSTNVCFFRNDAGDLLDVPYYADVITCASINRLKPRNNFRKSGSGRGCSGRGGRGGTGGGFFSGTRNGHSSSPHDEATCRAIMIRRAKKVIQACVRHGAHILILGAWGTGVFGNETKEAALWFREALRELRAAEAGEAGALGGIEEIVYAIPEADKVEEFRQVLGVKG